MKTFRVEYNDFNELQRVAREVIDYASDLKVVTLQGELGAGKTSLVKAMCRQFGVHTPVSSPTFTLVNEYLLPDGNALFHIDLYRLEKTEDARELGLEEYLLRDGWCVIEWPEKIESYLPDNFVSLKIEVNAPDNCRTITVRRVDELR